MRNTFWNKQRRHLHKKHIMRFFKAFSAMIIMAHLTHLSFSQEQLGLRTETFSGVNSLGLNPANYLSGSFNWDVNLVGAGVFGQTNYGFIRYTSLSEIIRLSPEADLASNYNSENQFPENTLILDFNDSNRRTYFNGSTTVMGPAFALRLESGHSFGVFTNFRTAVSAQQIPPSLNYYFFDRTPFGEAINIKPFSVAGMSWSEIGFNYARRVEMTSGNLDIGVSLKFLNGYEAFFLNSKGTFDLTQFPGDTILLASPELEYGLTTSNASGDDFSLNRNGGGLAVDIGAVFTIEGYDGPYLWKFGAALLDIGRINFTGNAQLHRINEGQTFAIPTRDYDDLDNVDEILELLSEQAIGNSTASLQGRNFKVWLPGALSLQADYRLMSNVFVNATLIQRMPYRQNTIQRGNLLAITPRFEHRWLSAALPVSLYNYEKLRVGAAIRLAFLTIGTENLGSFVGRSNFYGTDVYVGLKINPFNLGFNLGGGRSGKGVKCYDF